MGPVLAGATLFCTGLVIDGVAQSMWPFVVGRATQGLGAGLVIVALYVVVGRSYPDELRPTVFAALATAWVVPSIVGTLVAGRLADHESWRLVLLAVAPSVELPTTTARATIRTIHGRPTAQDDAGSAAGSSRSPRPRRTGIAIITGVGM